MASVAPDSAAVSALGGLLALLTFTNGFVSARLHTAYREALREQRTIDRELAAGPDTGLGVGRLPLAQLETQHRDVTNTMRETLAGPVLTLVWLATAGGVVLTELTRRQAQLDLIDTDHPEQSWALLLLALALIAVTGLTTTDYFRLRSRLRRLSENSLVGDILESERELARALSLKAPIRGRRLQAQQDTYSRPWILSMQHDTQKTLDLIGQPQPTGDGDPQAHLRNQHFALLNDITVALQTLDRQETERKQSERTEGAVLAEAERAISIANQHLERAATHLGGQQWAQLDGLRAMAITLKAWDPRIDEEVGGARVDAKALVFARRATDADPRSVRFWFLRSVLEERMGSVTEAGKSLLQAESQQIASLNQPGSLLEPQLKQLVELSYAALLPQRPSTYEAAVHLAQERTFDEYDPTDMLLQGWLTAAVETSAISIERDLVPPALQAVEAAVRAQCSTPLGWLSADGLIGLCRSGLEKTRAAQLPGGQVDAVRDALAVLKRNVIEPAEAEWSRQLHTAE